MQPIYWRVGQFAMVHGLVHFLQFATQQTNVKWYVEATANAATSIVVGSVASVGLTSLLASDSELGVAKSPIDQMGYDLDDGWLKPYLVREDIFRRVNDRLFDTPRPNERASICSSNFFLQRSLIQQTGQSFLKLQNWFPMNHKLSKSTRGQCTSASDPWNLLLPSVKSDSPTLSVPRLGTLLDVLRAGFGYACQ
jgi:hypothetical protein